MTCQVDAFEDLAELFTARAHWPRAAKIAVLADMECLGDIRMVGFMLRIIADPAQDDGLRMHVLRWFRCGNCAPAERRRVARAIQQIASESGAHGLRLHAVLALAQFADLQDVQEGLGGLMLDQNEPLDLRYCAFTSLEKAGLTPECRALLDRLADDTKLGPCARKALSLWGTCEHMLAT
jgi:hypothetical protein